MTYALSTVRSDNPVIPELVKLINLSGTMLSPDIVWFAPKLVVGNVKVFPE